MNRKADGMFQRIATFLTLILVSVAGAQDRVVQLPVRTDGPKSLDPVQGSTVYDNKATVQMYETLLEVAYYDTTRFVPLLLEDLPERLDDGKRWRFTLRDDIFFIDDECFPGGEGRKMVTDDVFYSWKRLADLDNKLENWWLLRDTIEGLEANAQGTKFDYDADVAGLVKIDDRTFEVVLTQPVYRFLWVLTMFQTSIVPHEAVEHYGEDFSRNPVGSGPFVLDEWVPKSHMTFDRNPAYRPMFYPEAELWSEEDAALGLAEAAGTRLPIADRLEFTFYIEDQPLWLEFRQNKLGLIQVPSAYFPEAFSKRSKRLSREFRQEGITHAAVPLLDYIFRAFNMEDELVGGYTPEKKALRRAISLAVDWDEFNQDFYEGLCTVYDGVIPPALEGHPENGRDPRAPRGPDIQAAKAALVEAGYPDGQGLPPIRFYTSQGGNNDQQVEMLQRQLSRINVKLDPILVDFSQLIEQVNKRQAPMFSFAWSSDYPDGENNLALFYGPNASPGSNHYNYNNPEYDKLYESIVAMEPGEERTRIYNQMQEMLFEDIPAIGALARVRYYLIAPWLKNAKPNERYYGWYKMLDADDSKR